VGRRIVKVPRPSKNFKVISEKDLTPGSLPSKCKSWNSPVLILDDAGQGQCHFLVHIWFVRVCVESAVKH